MVWYGMVPYLERERVYLQHSLLQYVAVSLRREKSLVMSSGSIFYFCGSCVLCEVG